MPPSDDASLSFLERVTWLLRRQPHKIDYALATSATPLPSDAALGLRIGAAYCHAMETFQPTASFWDQSFFAAKRNIHDAMISGSVEAIEAVLINPAETSLFWGFDGPTKPPADAWADAETAPRDPHAFVLRNANATADWHRLYGIWLMDSLVSAGEAMGILRADYPEISLEMPRQYPGGLSVDEIIDRMDQMLGLGLQFPNPFPGELGLPSRRGIVSFRAIQALYQAWRIWTLAEGNPDFSVLEIGAGLGRTAYFARTLGLRDYTIIDIPMTNLAQADFLCRTLDPTEVSLFTEPRAQTNILPPFMLSRLDRSFDLIVNVDSFTEMSSESMMDYYDFARRHRTPILSINHEYNANTFREVYTRDSIAKATRYPYWPRRGYVEEVVTWRNA